MSIYRPLLALALFLPGLAAATTRTWPGIAPCAGTLQACVDGATNGDRIEVASNTPIAEDISLYNRSLTLTASAGYSPAFGAGHWVSITTSAIAGDVTASLSKFSFTDGYVYATYNGTGTGNYELRDLRLVRNVADTTNYLRVEARSGTLNATVYNNRLSGVPASLNDGLIELNAKGGTLNASAWYNHVTSTNTAGFANGGGIFVDVAGAGSGGTIKLHGNEVRGAFSRAGIFFSEGLFSSTAVSYTARVYNNVVVGLDGSNSGLGGSGIGFVVYNGSIDAQAINNTVTRCYVGLSASRWGGGPAGTGTLSGLVKNNLLVASRGLSYSDFGITDTLTDGVTSDYNLLNADVNFAPAGAHDITAPANLVSITGPRLRAGSPAIDAADTATLGFGIIFNGLSLDDADGLRRITGPSDDADIGAYESGNTTFLHTASADNTSAGSYITRFDNAASNVASADPFITANYNAGIGGGGGVTLGNPLGVYYFSGFWRAFFEDTATPFPLGGHLNVFVAAPGSGRIRHTATAANTSGNVSTVDASGLNGTPDRIVLAAQNWSVASVYNNHPVAVAYDAAAASGAGRWTVVNGDGAAMPANAGFNLYFQEPSPNAMRIVAATGTLIGNQLLLDHPLLNATPCALVQASRVFTPGSSPVSTFDVFFASDQTWRIFSYGSGGVHAGDVYDVVIDPAQVFACTDRIFANGFE